MEMLEHMNAKQRRAERRRRNQARRDARMYARMKRKDARLSKRQAKRLKKIYGDATPEEIEEINKVQPFIASMNEQLTDKGVEVENPEDESEVVAKYNTEILEEDAPENYTEAYSDNFDDFDKEKAKNAMKTIFGAIAGAFTARKEIAEEKARKGMPLNDGDKAVITLKETGGEIIDTKKKNAFNDALKTYLPIAALIALLYFIFKNK